MTGVEAWAVGATLAFMGAVQAWRETDRAHRAALAELDRERSSWAGRLQELETDHRVQLNEKRRSYNRRLLALIRAAREWRGPRRP